MKTCLRATKKAEIEIETETDVNKEKVFSSSIGILHPLWKETPFEMSSIAANRLKRELLEMSGAITLANAAKLSNSEDFKVRMVNSSMFHLLATVPGPPDTPYFGGLFELDIKVPDRYPFAPPSVRFLTRIWHPNISSVTGVICLDILKDKWAAAMTIRSVLLSIQALLQDPEPNNPQDAVVAGQYLRSLTVFNQTATFWTEFFAFPRSESNPQNSVDHMRTRYPECVRKVKDLVALLPPSGTLVNAIEKLSAHDWNIEKTAQSL